MDSRERPGMCRPFTLITLSDLCRKMVKLGIGGHGRTKTRESLEYSGSSCPYIIESPPLVLSSSPTLVQAAQQHIKKENADICEDPDWQDHHLGGGGFRHHRECEGQDPGQGRHPSRPAETYLCWKAAGGRTHP